MEVLGCRNRLSNLLSCLPLLGAAMYIHGKRIAACIAARFWRRREETNASKNRQIQGLERDWRGCKCETLWIVARPPAFSCSSRWLCNTYSIYVGAVYIRVLRFVRAILQSIVPRFLSPSFEGLLTGDPSML